MTPVSVELTISAQGRQSQKGQIAVVDLELISQVADADPTHRKTITVAIGRAYAEIVSLVPGSYIARVRLPSGERFNDLVIVYNQSQNHITLGKKHPIKRERSVPLEQKIIKIAEERSDYGTSREIINQQSPAVSQETSIDSGGFGYVPRHTPLQGGEVISDWLVPISSTLPLDAFIRSSTQRPLTGQIDERNGGEVQISICSTEPLENLRESILTKYASDPSNLLGALALKLDARELRAYKVNQRRSTAVVPGESLSNAESRLNYLVAASSPEHVDSNVSEGAPYVKLIRLPGPWIGPVGGQPRDVTVDVVKSKSGAIDLKLKIDDPITKSILDFSQQNDLKGAMAVLDTSMEALFRKVVNPYAAAGAAYVLLMAPPNFLPPEWYQWIVHLWRWFDDLPDGRILHATLLLQRFPTSVELQRLEPAFFPKAEAARVEYAAQLILHSLYIGLPLYRSGIALLASNLEILSNSSLPRHLALAVDSAYRTVRSVQLRLDTSQFFTTLNFGAAAEY
jgi:hypothetical protein